MSPDSLKNVLNGHAKWAHGKSGGAKANLAMANLARAYLDGANLDGANLAMANLAMANLDGANLSKANLSKANLAMANLAMANLAGAYLAGANLDGANLAMANLDGAKLQNDAIVVALVARVTRVIDPYEFFAWRTDKGDFIKAGCRFLTVAEYREHAKSYKGNAAKYAETVAILDFIEARFAATVTP